jgi:tRNA-splicing ligase RtcB (3'-phosphate/5'-hydroxy nucleic acid ligase)
VSVERLAPHLLSWASIVDDRAREQAARTASMPFIHPHLALMPDAHLGKGATVGSVIPTLGAIIPAAVGVDIGCGMDALLTQWTGAELRHRGALGPLRVAIADAVPLSAGHYNETIRDHRTAQRIGTLESKAESAQFDPAEYGKNWTLQLGSLGSGNHFIEVSTDEQDRVWLFLHSGSRGVGNRIAARHIAVARDLARRYWITLPDPDLAYLVEGTDEFWAYIRQMRWAQEFARLNRAEMMDRVADCLGHFMGGPVETLEHVTCHHNYTEQERHGGKDVWLSRKGAIDATKGTLGLIPGSMGDKSYVVVGRGNPASLNSAPHGAGRSYSRTAARKAFTLDDLKERMAGIEWSGSAEFIDEHPLAYKPIDQVMADAADLVEIRHTLRQVINVKGD